MGGVSVHAKGGSDRSSRRGGPVEGGVPGRTPCRPRRPLGTLGAFLWWESHQVCVRSASVCPAEHGHLTLSPLGCCAAAVQEPAPTDGSRGGSRARGSPCTAWIR